MFDLKLATAFIGWTATTFVAHFSVKRILVAAAPAGAEVNTYTSAYTNTYTNAYTSTYTNTNTNAYTSTYTNTHYSVKRILVAAAPDGAEVWSKVQNQEN